MKIEVKGLTVVRGLSEETTAYSATIYVDGVKSFDACNHGHGGGDIFRRVGTVTEQEVNAWLAVNVAPSGPYDEDMASRASWDHGLTCDLELFVGRVIADRENAAEVSRITKGYHRLLVAKIAGLLNGELKTWKAAPTPDNLATLRRTRPDVEIMNDASDEAKARGLAAYCPELAGISQPVDYEEQVHARFREGQTTLADARYLLAAEARADKPCSDIQAHLTEIIAIAEAQIAASKAERENAAKNFASKPLVGVVS